MSGYMSIKRYTPDFFRVIHLRRHDKSHIQKPPVDAECNAPACDGESSFSAPLSPTEGEKEIVRRKPRTSYARAKTAVFEYAICNEWQYFVTLTPDGKNDDYYDIDTFMDHVSMWVRNLRRKPEWSDLKYILVPERFKSGEGWHLHGFFKGIPEGEAVPFNLDDAHSKKHRRKLQDLNEKGYLSFPAYSRRFGWATLSPIKDPRKAAGYISKYITKELSSRAEDLGCSLYYPCRGLNRAQEVFSGEVKVSSIPVESETYWNDLQGTIPFIAHNDYGSFGNCTGWDIFVAKDTGEIELKVYTDKGQKEVTVFDILAFSEHFQTYVMQFADLIPVDDPDNPFENTQSKRSGQFETAVQRL